MSSKERFLYIAVVFFGVYYLISMYSSNEKEYINEYNSKIKALEQNYVGVVTRKKQMMLMATSSA